MDIILNNDVSANRTLIAAPSGYGKTTAVMNRTFGSILDLDCFIKRDTCREDSSYEFFYHDDTYDYIKSIDQGLFICCLTNDELLSCFSKIIVLSGDELLMTESMIINSLMRNYRHGISLDYLYEYECHQGEPINNVIDDNKVSFNKSFLLPEFGNVMNEIVYYYNKHYRLPTYKIKKEFNKIQVNNFKIVDFGCYYLMINQLGSYRVTKDEYRFSVSGLIQIPGLELECSIELKNLLMSINIFNLYDLSRPGAFEKIYSNKFIDLVLRFSLHAELDKLWKDSRLLLGNKRI